MRQRLQPIEKAAVSLVSYSTLRGIATQGDRGQCADRRCTNPGAPDHGCYAEHDRRFRWLRQAFYVVATVVVWGRGTFCGWLCPFGALQEFAAILSKLVQVPQRRCGRQRHGSRWPHEADGCLSGPGRVPFSRSSRGRALPGLTRARASSNRRPFSFAPVDNLDPWVGRRDARIKSRLGHLTYSSCRYALGAACPASTC